MIGSIDDIFNDINNWLRDHNLVINYIKTKIIQFRLHLKTPLHINFKINNSYIETVYTFNCFGITIDTHINWKQHIQKLSSKLYITFVLIRLKKITDINIATTVSFLTGGKLDWGIPH